MAYPPPAPNRIALANLTLRVIIPEPPKTLEYDLARDFAETEVEMRGAAGSDMSDYQNEAQKVFDDCDAIIRRASDVPPAALLQATGGENGRAPLLKVGDLRRAAISIDDAAEENGQDGEPDEVLVDVAASLAAAISLLERGGRKASPSDKMFKLMLSDYRGSLSRARQALSSQGRHEGGEG